MNKSSRIELILDALNSPLGLLVEADSPESAKLLQNQLYSVMRDDPDLAGISLSISRTNPCQLLVMKNAQAGPDETHPAPAEG